VAEKLMHAVIDWLVSNEARTIDEAESQEIREQLEEAIEFGDGDGYSIARLLDDLGWSPDSELVDILDRAAQYESEALDALVYEWLVANQTQPAHCVGDVVQYNSGAGRPVNIYTGTIIEIDPKGGKYVIHVPELGHVADGQVGIQGTYVPWEVIDAEDI
jgi:hypothetical protein